MKAPKTNAMRLLDQAGVKYSVLTYEYDENDLSGLKAASVLNMPPETVYKTLVMKGDRTGFLVCCLAVDREADLKAVAGLSGDKRVEMIPQKELLPLTGYQRGGCSPIGMKKAWPTYIDAPVLLQARIAVSAGQRGLQMVLAPQDLIRVTAARTGALSHT